MTESNRLPHLDRAILAHMNEHTRRVAAEHEAIEGGREKRKQLSADLFGRLKKINNEENKHRENNYRK